MLKDKADYIDWFAYFFCLYAHVPLATICCLLLHKIKNKNPKVVYMYVCVCGEWEKECQRYKLSPKLSFANPYDRNTEKVKKFKKVVF